MEETGKRAREEEEPQQPERQQEQQQQAKKRDKRKVRVAVLHGYRGRGYHGNTANTGSEHLPTIDLELQKAFHGAGLISDANFGTLKNVGWNRCARTDKGVSAMCNLISIKAEFAKDELDNKAAVVERVNTLLPAHIRVWSLLRVKGHFDGKNEVDGRTYEYVAPAFCFRPTTADEATWVFDEAARQKLNAAMLYFLGTHNFHNYTKGKHFNDPECKRVITHFSAQQIIHLPTGTFVLFRIKGQSFMLHQIRKMVCSLIVLCRNGRLDDAKRVIGGTLQATKVNIPKAPAVGLFLRQVHFDSYNKQWGQGEGREPVELTPEQVKKADAFAAEFIWPDIASSANDFVEWLGKSELVQFDFDAIVAAYDAMVAAREERQSMLGPKVHIQDFSNIF